MGVGGLLVETLFSTVLICQLASKVGRIMAAWSLYHPFPSHWNHWAGQGKENPLFGGIQLAQAAKITEELIQLPGFLSFLSLNIQHPFNLAEKSALILH